MSKQFEATQANWKPAYTQILYWAQKGLPAEEIGKKVGMCKITIERIKGSVYFRERLQSAQEAYEIKRSERLADIQLSDPIQRKLEKAAKKAADVLVSALKGTKDISRQQIFVAKDLLDRTGYKAKERIEVDTHNHNYTPREIASAQTTLLEVQEILSTIGMRGTNYLISKARISSSTSDLPQRLDTNQVDIADAAEISSEPASTD